MSRSILLAAALLLCACPDEPDGGEQEGDDFGECDDGFDNDADGDIDCDDVGCSGQTACVDGDDDDTSADDDDTSSDDDDTSGDDDDTSIDDDDTSDDDDDTLPSAPACDDEIVTAPGDTSLATAPELVTFCTQYNATEGDLLFADDLETLDGLDCLCEVGGSLLLSSRQHFTDVLLNLRSIGGSLVAPEGEGTSLERIQLSALQTIGGDLQAIGSSLGDVDLPLLTSVGDDVTLVVPAVVGGALSMPLLATIGGDVSVQNTGADALSLPALTEVGGAVHVEGLYNLTSLDLPALATIAGALELVDIHQIEAPVLPSLGSVGGLDFSGNAAMTVFAAPLLAAVDGPIDVFDNAALATLDLGDVPSATALRLEENWTLSALDLGSLASISGDVTLVNLSSLPHVDGLAALQTIGGGLTITDDHSLTSLTGLQAVTSVGGDLVIRDNPVLPTSQAEALRDTIGLANIGGVVTILNNANN